MLMSKNITPFKTTALNKTKPVDYELLQNLRNQKAPYTDLTRFDQRTISTFALNYMIGGSDLYITDSQEVEVVFNGNRVMNENDAADMVRSQYSAYTQIGAEFRQALQWIVNDYRGELQTSKDYAVTTIRFQANVMHLTKACEVNEKFNDGIKPTLLIDVRNTDERDEKLYISETQQRIATERVEKYAEGYVVSTKYAKWIYGCDRMKPEGLHYQKEADFIISPQLGGQSKVAATLMDLVYKAKVIVYLGGSPGHWLSELNTKSKVIVNIDPRDPVFECIHIGEKLTYGNMNRLGKQVYGYIGKRASMSWAKTIDNPILLIGDLRTNPEGYTKYSDKWDEQVDADERLSHEFARELSQYYQLICHMKCRPTKKNKLMDPSGYIRLQPFNRLGSNELRYVYVMNKDENKYVSVSPDLLRRFTKSWNDMRSLRQDGWYDIQAWRHYIMKITKRVRYDDWKFGKKTRYCGIYSLSNSLNSKTEVLSEMVSRGMENLVVTFPYAGIIYSTGRVDGNVVTEIVEDRIYSDNYFTIYDELLMHQMIVVEPLWFLISTKDINVSQSLLQTILVSKRWMGSPLPKGMWQTLSWL